MAAELHPSPHAAFARGQLLQQQNRIDDAISCYKQALDIDGNHAPSFMMLALCWTENPDTTAQAVDAARRAIALEPEDAFARSVLALALNANAKDGQTAAMKAALLEAQEAVGLDPTSDFSHAVVARMHLRLRDYPKAEEAARLALAFNTENTMATEVLSAALLLQRKDEHHKHLIAYQLERDAEDDSAHNSSGWQALMEGDHVRANQHFLEALRLNAMNESARMGLVESFRARSWPYRLQLRFSHFMNQFTEGKQTAIMLGGFVAYRILTSVLKGVSPLLASLVIAAWLVFALWSHLARGFGSAFMVMDRFARQALQPAEYWEGVVVGGLIFASLSSFVLGFAWGMPSEGGSAALTLILAAVVNAAAFTNDHWIGRRIYAAAAVVCGILALYVTADAFGHLGLPYAASLGVFTLITSIVFTWLRSLRVLYR